MYGVSYTNKGGIELSEVQSEEIPTISRKKEIVETPLSKIIPPGESGTVKIDHYVTSEMNSFQSMFGGIGYCPSNLKIVRLCVDGQLMMTNTPAEMDTNMEFIYNAKGDILIGGLGIGMLLSELDKRNKEYTSITVIEKSSDVIKLVAPYFPKVKVIEGNIFEWKPEKGTKFDCLYFDIWPSASEDNLPDMSKLHNKFKFFKKKGGWMGSWMQKTLQARKRTNDRADRCMRFFY